MSSTRPGTARWALWSTRYAPPEQSSTTSASTTRMAAPREPSLSTCACGTRAASTASRARWRPGGGGRGAPPAGPGTTARRPPDPEELLGDGLSDEELRALRLLCREGSTSDTAYLGHIELIARAGGPAGRLACAVKRADLEDRQRHPLVHRNGWSPPYASALDTLEQPEPARSRGAA